MNEEWSPTGLRAHLEWAADLKDEGSGVSALLTRDECRKLLALLKATKDFYHHAVIDTCGDDDYQEAFYSCRDTLLNAIHAIEGPPERVAGRPERMPPGGGEGP